jgi:6-phosphogluconolactonase
MTPGREPRGFTLDPTGTWVLVGNQMIGTMSVFRRDPESGKLTATPKTIQLDKAVCLLFV